MDALRGWLLTATLVLLAPVGALAQAPTGAMDTEARALFEAGTTAFDDGRYADALEHFQRAYELSARPALLYNVGIAADRLRRDAEALAAFDAFLEAVPDHPRRRDVEARVVILRAALASQVGDAVEPPPATSIAPETAVIAPAPQRDRGPSTFTIVGASVLGALGVAGLVTAIVGIAGADGCSATDASGTCVEEQRPAWAAIGLYGGLGLAAIAGAVVWLVIDSSDDGGSAVEVGLTPTGLRVQGSF